MDRSLFRAGVDPVVRAAPATVDDAPFDALSREFFRAVSFEPGGQPDYARLHDLFVDGGLLIRNSGPMPEVSTVGQFIRPRLASVRAGELTRFHEMELVAVTEVFGHVAHRFGSYAKTGLARGVPFAARGMVSTQFVHTQRGWRISAMAWDDERAGLVLPPRYEPRVPAAGT